MRIAVLSDIHGYSLAFDRVLDDIRSHHGIDEIIIAGDLCEGGPDPAGVLERMSTLDAIVLQGNTDRDIGNARRASEVSRFTMDAIGEEGQRYLRELPFSHRVSPPHSEEPGKDLLVVHANPFDQDRHIRPDAGPHEIKELIGDTEAAVIAFGHLHIAYIRDLRAQTLIDVSAVGNPKDGDLRSKWGLIQWDGDQQCWRAALNYVAYPLAETEEQIRSSGIPDPDQVIRKLRKASY